MTLVVTFLGAICCITETYILKYSNESWFWSLGPYTGEDQKAGLGRLFPNAGEITVRAAICSVSFLLWPCLLSAVWGVLCSRPSEFLNSTPRVAEVQHVE